jgi:hypothetical protein
LPATAPLPIRGRVDDSLAAPAEPLIEAGFAPRETGSTGLPQRGETTESSPAAHEGLARRSPKAVTPTSSTNGSAAQGVAATTRSPEEVRQMLSRYRSGLRRGKNTDPEQEIGG